MAVALNRRSLLLGGPALGAAGGVAAHAGQQRSSGRLRIGYLPITNSAPLLVAHGNGLFRAPRVEVEKPVLFRGWAALAEAFLARQVDVVHLLMPFAVQLRFALGAPVRILGWPPNGSSLTVRRDIQHLEQLAGTRVAIPYWWSIHNIVLQDMLRRAGLRPVVRTTPSTPSGTVELVVMSPSDMVPALDAGSISGYIVADPFNAVAEIKGGWGASTGSSGTSGATTLAASSSPTGTCSTAIRCGCKDWWTRSPPRSGGSATPASRPPACSPATVTSRNPDPRSSRRSPTPVGIRACTTRSGRATGSVSSPSRSPPTPPS